jgi:hypothetical protein
MQLNKSSKKTKKTVDKASVAASEKSAATAEMKPKPRTLTSSTPKKSEEKSAASPSHHHKIDSAPVATEVRAAESKSPLSKPAVLELVETVTVAETVTKIATHEDIARLAHSFWVARGYAHGSPHEDWLRAERELLQS